MFDHRRFLRHDAGPAAQFVKYALAGGIATVTHIAIFNLLGWRLFPCLQPQDPFIRYLHLDAPLVAQAVRARNSMLANACGFMVSNFVAYLLNILFVFRPGRHHRLVELGLFYAVSGVSLVVGTSLMGWLIAHFDMLTTIAFGSNLVVALAINFAMRKFVIFRG